jgi:hypothetical protein
MHNPVWGIGEFKLKIMRRLVLKILIFICPELKGLYLLGVGSPPGNNKKKAKRIPSSVNYRKEKE